MVNLIGWLVRCRHTRFLLVVIAMVCACVLLFCVPPASLRTLTFPTQLITKAVDKGAEDTVREKPQSLHQAGPQPEAVNPCTNKPWGTLSSVPKFRQSPEISQRHNLLYCPVGKVGSSYFTRLMLTLDHMTPSQTNVPSPFTIPITEAGRGRCDSLEKLGSAQQKLDFLRRSELLVFGRDPYRRIFSAWLDKLYSPNPYYWHSWGANALRLDKASRREGTKCNVDVSFRQFVSLVVAKGGLHATDVHLRPVAEECRMCEIKYTILGKIESTSKDLDLLGSRLNVALTFHREPDYGVETAMDTVRDAVGSAFSWRSEIFGCGVSLDRMGRTIWRKLQLRGVFDSSEPYPFTARELDFKMPVERFITACRAAIINSKDRKKLRRQKEAAFLEAYSEVDQKDLAKIAELYQKDFQFFGYDTRPELLYGGKSKSSTTGAFDWSQEWVL